VEEVGEIEFGDFADNLNDVSSRPEALFSDE
jgi:hypothetical protein